MMLQRNNAMITRFDCIVCACNPAFVGLDDGGKISMLQYKALFIAVVRVLDAWPHGECGWEAGCQRSLPMHVQAHL